MAWLAVRASRTVFTRVTDAVFENCTGCAQSSSSFDLSPYENNNIVGFWSDLGDIELLQGTTHDGLCFSLPMVSMVSISMPMDSSWQ